MGLESVLIIFTMENFHKVGKWVVLKTSLKIYRIKRIALGGRFLRIYEVIKSYLCAFFGTSLIKDTISRVW